MNTDVQEQRIDQYFDQIKHEVGNIVSEGNKQIDNTIKEMNNFEQDLKDKKFTILDHFKKNYKEALDSNNFNEAQRLHGIIDQLEDLEDFKSYRDICSNKPNAAIISDNFKENIEKEYARADKRLKKYKKYTFKYLDELQDNITILSKDKYTEEQAFIMYCFIIKQINFKNIERNAIFISKVLYNLHQYIRENDQSYQDFANKLLEVMEIVISLNESSGN